MHHASSKSLCDVLVLSEIFICLSVTISLIRSEGGVGGRREEDGAPERGRRRGVLSTSPRNSTLPHRRLGLWLLLPFFSPLPLFSLTLSHLLILLFQSFFNFYVCLRCFVSACLGGISLSLNTPLRLPPFQHISLLSLNN